MEKQFIPTSETPQITLKVDGELTIKGSDEAEVVAKSDSADNLTLDQNGDIISITSQANCTVRVPRESVVVIEACNGNASIKALEGSLNIQKINGNLFLRNVGVVHVERVSGNLFVKHVDGDFNLQVVEGNANLRDIQGDFMVTGGIHGNLTLDEVEGNASARVDGNVSLRLDPLPGQTYDFTADGNILCRLPADTSAVVNINRAERAKIQLAKVSLSDVGKFPYQLTLGEGDATLVFSADGNVDLVGRAPDWEMPEEYDASYARDFDGIAEDIGEQIENQVAAQMDMMESQLNAQLENLSETLNSAGLSAEQVQRTREAGARAAERAHEKMQRAQEKIRRKIEFAQRRAEQRARSAEKRGLSREKRTWGFEWPGAKPDAGSEPVTDEERLVILKMLEQKKITPEEADQLLSALEGKSGEQ
jgi:hypothetical protein